MHDIHIIHNDLASSFVVTINDLTHFVINQLRGVIRHVFRLCHTAPKEHFTFIFRIQHRA
ncbi:Uncharacterised protein [Vibrio cholerae]|nr:Uncharacterised protein [Vibrio cholerae]